MKPSDNDNLNPRELKPLYVDNHLIAFSKPFNLATQPSNDHEISLEGLAKEWVKITYQKPGAVFLHPIHRLDKVTGGIVLFAKTSKALSRMQEQMREQKIERIYYTLLPPTFSQLNGALEHHLAHDDHHATIVSAKHPEGKLARLTFRTLKQTKEATLVEVKLQTGRYHQIRAQFAHIHFPILGDVKYGSNISYNDGHIALYHTKMSFEHPVTKEMITISSEDPFHL